MEKNSQLEQNPQGSCLQFLSKDEMLKNIIWSKLIIPLEEVDTIIGKVTIPDVDELAKKAAQELRNI
jgi:hypothetical protein